MDGAGWLSSAIFSTQRMRCLLVVGGAIDVAVFMGWRSSFADQSFLLLDWLSTNGR